MRVCSQARTLDRNPEQTNDECAPDIGGSARMHTDSAAHAHKSPSLRHVCSAARGEERDSCVKIVERRAINQRVEDAAQRCIERIE